MKIKSLILVLVMVLVMTLGMTRTALATAGTDSSTEEKNAPVYDITINIVPEKGWLVNNSTVDIKVIDNKNTGTFQIKKVEAKIGADGTYQDVTDTMSIEVSEKSSVYVTVTDSYGTTYTQTRYIDGYDTTAPTFNVAVNNGVMTIETNDNESGVAAIYINGYKYKPNKKGKLTVRLQKFDASYANFSIYVIDNSGNQSEPYIIDNPYYKASADEGDDSGNPADSLPTSGEATDTGESSAQVVSVTDEEGNDISNEVKSKQFYSIVTKNGQQFYLVIDMSNVTGTNEHFEGSMDTPAADTSNGMVYFLTYVSNNDLLNVTSSDEVTLGYNSVAGGNNIDEEATSDNTEEMEETEEEMEEEANKQSESGNNPMVLIIVFGVVGVIVIVTVKSKSSGKNKTPIDDESEDEAEAEEEYEYFDPETYEEEIDENKENGEEKDEE